jgi:3-oxoacyl-[acyl-carrier-protein] synthase III
MSVGVSAIEYCLPSQSLSLRELARLDLLISSPEQLQEFGFDCCYISDAPAERLALRAATLLLSNANVEPESIDLLLYASAIAPGHQVSGEEFLSHFNYPAARLQYELGLLRATSMGISQSGCMGLTRAVKCAEDFLCANPQAERALCVSADVLPHGVPREIMYNVISDGACAVLVERNSSSNCILAHRAVTKGYYWDCVARKQEIVAAYFPTAKNVIEAVLAAAGCRAEELRMVLPHNVSRRSWDILLGLIAVKEEQLFLENIAHKGHVIAADNWINLKDATDRHLLAAGDKLLMFNFGFGANWAATLIEH